MRRLEDFFQNSESSGMFLVYNEKHLYGLVISDFYSGV